MALAKERTVALCTKFGAGAQDTGNAKVQIAICTERIKDLTLHTQNYKHDSCAKRSLLKIVGHRRRLLKYLKNRNLDEYRALIKELGLRK